MNGDDEGDEVAEIVSDSSPSTTNTKQSETPPNMEILDEWQVAKRGIIMWLNNEPDKAESFLKERIHTSVHITTSYCFINVINGIIGYELDKMELAQTMLRDLEQRCTTNSTWLQSIRSMLFTSSSNTRDCNSPNNNRPLAERLEMQIVLADVQLCSAILTFLTQDISGMMRGSWLLKRAWKIYQSVYQQIFTLYRDAAGHDADILNILPPLSAANAASSMRHSTSSTSTVHTNSDWSITSTDSIPTAPAAAVPARKGIVQSFSEYFLPSSSSAQGVDEPSNNNKKKKSFRKSKKNKIPRSKSSPDAANQVNNNAGGQCASSSLSADDIDPRVINRLMGAISFGYGAFQLAVSLLPPSMLRLVSFFGFHGDREIGLQCLQFSRTTADMRSPLATIALLWYLTVGNQIFAADSDDNSRNENNIAQVTAILSESEKDFAESSLFDFFKGRLARMHKDMPAAIEHFERAYYSSVLPELRLLCLHEIGWCRLIQLDCLNAIDEFHALRVNSEYSKSFFSYLTALCHGVAGRPEELPELRGEIQETLRNAPPQREQANLIDQFIGKRLELLPSTDDALQRVPEVFWRFLVYELLFLWNTLDTCTPAVLQHIIADCERERSHEPIPGLAKLLLGTCEKLRGNLEKANAAYRDCLKCRRAMDAETNAFNHISAFANYKLAMLLLNSSGGCHSNEAHQLLLTAQNKYKNYDFESRLSLRIHTAIKELSK